MRVYIDSCSEEALSLAERIGIGITTNPSLILREKCTGNLLDLIQHLRRSSISIVFFQIENLDERVLTLLNPEKFVIKVPWIAEKYNLHVLLKEKGFRVCATAVYEISQLVFAINFGVDYVAFYYDRAQQKGINSHERIVQFKHIIKNSNQNTKLIVASLKNTQQVIDAVESGADEIAIPLEVFKEFIKVPKYVEEDVKKFSEDFSKLLSLSLLQNRGTS